MSHAGGPLVLFVATRKGLWLVHGDRQRRKWRVDGPHFLGHEIHHVVLDPRDRRTLLAAAKTGHLGPTVFRSQDLGQSWQEASEPPAFRKAGEGETGYVVDHVFWLTPGHASEPGVWYAGSSPEGLFRTADGGETWQPLAGFNEHANYKLWTEGTAPRGFVAAGVACGIKRQRADGPAPLDLALLSAESPVPAAAVFTTNKAVAAPVVVSRQNLARSGGRIKAIVVNSGCANAATGSAGLTVAREMAELAGDAVSCPPEQVLVASTGVIDPHRQRQRR
jgi:hypothetical protein